LGLFVFVRVEIAQQSCDFFVELYQFFKLFVDGFRANDDLRKDGIKIKINQWNQC